MTYTTDSPLIGTSTGSPEAVLAWLALMRFPELVMQPHVLRLSHWFKMIWIYASVIFASVMQHRIRRKFTSHLFPYRPMRQNLTAFVAGFSIPTGCQDKYPIPASGGLVNYPLRFVWMPWTPGSKRRGAGNGTTFSNSRCQHQKRASANRADAFERFWTGTHWRAFVTLLPPSIPMSVFRDTERTERGKWECSVTSLAKFCTMTGLHLMASLQAMRVRRARAVCAAPGFSLPQLYDGGSLCSR